MQRQVKIVIFTHRAYIILYDFFNLISKSFLGNVGTSGIWMENGQLDRKYISLNILNIT